MATNLDDRSSSGEGAEAEHAGSDAVAGDPSAPTTSETGETGAAPSAAAPSAADLPFEPDRWDQPPAAPLRTPMPTQSAVSRLGDVLVSPFGRHRRETMVVLSLVVLAVLVWVALTELLVAPGASQSILS